VPSIRNLVRSVNPVREDRRVPLSERAESELAGLVGPAARTAAPARKVGPQRRLVLATGAFAVVALAAGTAFWALNSSPPPPSAAEPFYQDLPSLERSADIIVRATVTATRDETREGVPETVAEAAVVASAKGDVATGETFEFAYTTPGAAAEAPTGIKVGGEYVLLLVSRKNAPAFVVSSIQGYYPVAGNRAVPVEANPVELTGTVKSALKLG
jgi:hypothetical protein